MNDYRLITYTLDQVAMDYEHVARKLTEACERTTGHFRITGVCQTHNHACFPCERTPEPMALRYVLAPVNGDSTDELAADLHTRWRSQFTTIGMLRLGQTCLGLFAIPAHPES